MQYLKRLLALMLVFFGWKSLQAEPLPASPAPSTQPTASQSGAPKPAPVSTNLVVSPANGPAITTEQEQKARALLEQATGAAIAADSRVKPAAPAAAPATELDRDREISRIEAAVAEAQKRREAKGEIATPPAATPEPAPSAAPAVAVTPTPAAPAAPVAPLTPSVPSAPAVATAPAPAAQTPGTLTGDKEVQARELLDRLSKDLASKPAQGQDTPVPPAAVPITPAPAPVSTPVVAVTPAPAAPVPKVAPAVPVVSSAPAPVAPAAPAAITPAIAANPAALSEQTQAPLSATDESKARALLRDKNSTSPATLEEQREKQILSLLRAKVVMFEGGNSGPLEERLPNAAPANKRIPPGGVPATPEQALPATPLPPPIEPRGGQPEASSSTSATVQLAQAAPKTKSPAPIVQTPPTLTSDKEQQARELLDRVSKDLAGNPSQAKDAAPAPTPSPAAPVTPPAAVLTPATAAIAPPAAAAQTPGTLTTDKEMQARELLDRVGRDIANKPVVAPAAAPTAPVTPAVVVHAPVTTAPTVSVPAPAVSPAGAMTPDNELKARNLLNQAAGRSTTPAVTAPAISTPSVTVTTVAPPSSPVVAAPSTSPSSRTLTLDKEARARELLAELRGEKPAAPTTHAPQALVATTPGTVPVTPPSVAIAPPPATIAPVPVPATPSSQAVIQPAPALVNTTPAGPVMTPEQEAQAREVLNRNAGKVGTSTAPLPATATTAPATDGRSELEAYRDARKRAEQDAKLRKKAEDKARKEMERMQEETKLRAKEDLRRKAEAEARARKETEMTVSSVRTKEKEEFRRRSEGETIAPQEGTPVVAKAAPVPEEVKTVSTAKKASNGSTSTRPEEDPAFPASKRQQLMKLLNDYRQDKITPEEYHSGRAKVIASP